MKIVVCAPANRFTGGPTLSHQLCRSLIDFGYDAKMFYYRAKKNVSPIHPNYEKFNNPIIDNIPSDSSQLLIVAPETAPDLLKHHSKAKKVIWWMSVDNYFDKYLTSRRNRILNIGGLLKYNVFGSDNFHLAQSQYAVDFLEDHGVDKSKIFYLSDYVDDVFLNNTWEIPGRKNRVVFSPKRGLVFTQKIINEMPDVEFVPLQNMSQDEMINAMNESKLYIDFGNHPGKDRIPREAVLCGCCIITGKDGSAKNDIDVCIPQRYKFDGTDEQIPIIVETIREVLCNYENVINDFSYYREKIQKEKSEFNSDTKNAFKILCE